MIVVAKTGEACRVLDISLVRRTNRIQKDASANLFCGGCESEENPGEMFCQAEAGCDHTGRRQDDCGYLLTIQILWELKTFSTVWRCNFTYLVFGATQIPFRLKSGFRRGRKAHDCRGVPLVAPVAAASMIADDLTAPPSKESLMFAPKEFMVETATAPWIATLRLRSGHPGDKAAKQRLRGGLRHALGSGARRRLRPGGTFCLDGSDLPLTRLLAAHRAVSRRQTR